MRTRLAAVTKRCSKCGLTHPIDWFYRKAKARDGYQAQCKGCQNATRNAWAKLNPEKAKVWRKPDRRSPEKRRDQGLRRRHGITLERWNEMFESQGGRCAACKRSEEVAGRFHVDHDHACCDGRSTRGCGQCVRALLCFTCNAALGNVKDSVERLEHLVIYLRQQR